MYAAAPLSVAIASCDKRLLVGIHAHLDQGTSYPQRALGPSVKQSQRSHAADYMHVRSHARILPCFDGQCGRMCWEAMLTDAALSDEPQPQGRTTCISRFIETWQAIQTPFDPKFCKPQASPEDRARIIDGPGLHEAERLKDARVGWARKTVKSSIKQVFIDVAFRAIHHE
jgi:hypothetical protein